MITLPVTMADKIKLHMYLGKLKLQKTIRNYNVINDEYNLGIWNKQYDDIDFETRSGMYGKRDNGEYSIFVLDDVMFKGKRKDWAEQFERQILDVLDNYIDQPIVECIADLIRQICSVFVVEVLHHHIMITTALHCRRRRSPLCMCIRFACIPLSTYCNTHDRASMHPWCTRARLQRNVHERALEGYIEAI